MNSTFGAPGAARSGRGHAGVDSCAVRPITPGNAWPGSYSVSPICPALPPAGPHRPAPREVNARARRLRSPAGGDPNAPSTARSSPGARSGHPVRESWTPGKAAGPFLVGGQKLRVVDCAGVRDLLDRDALKKALDGDLELLAGQRVRDTRHGHDLVRHMPRRGLAADGDADLIGQRVVEYRALGEDHEQHDLVTAASILEPDRETLLDLGLGVVAPV